MPSFGFGGEVRGLPFSTVKAGPCGTGKNHPRCAPVFLPVALPVEARHGGATEIRMTPCPPVNIYSYESICTYHKDHRYGLAVESNPDTRFGRRVRIPLYKGRITCMGGVGDSLFQGILPIPL